EQIIFEGKEIQRQIFLSSHSSNHLQPVTIHKMDRSIKNIAVTGLLLSSRLAVTSGDYRIKNGNSEGEDDFYPLKNYRDMKGLSRRIILPQLRSLTWQVRC
ncbi:hypothetical protein SEET0821_07738, partial [Salmonella enterica subsp. enterica serovar Tennessee str. TXSC_TXSC08-21]